MDVCQEAATVLPSADHAKRAEKADSVVEHAVAKTVQFHEVRAETHHLEAIDLRLLLHDSQHVAGEVDAERSEAATSQRDQGPARAAAEVSHQAGLGEMAGDDLFVELEELVEGEVVVVFGGDALGVGILPDTAGNPSGELPLWTRGEGHESTSGGEQGSAG